MRSTGSSCTLFPCGKIGDETLTFVSIPALRAGVPGIVFEGLSSSAGRRVIDAVKGRLERLGVPLRHIHYERFEFERRIVRRITPVIVATVAGLGVLATFKTSPATPSKTPAFAHAAAKTRQRRDAPGVEPPRHRLRLSTARERRRRLFRPVARSSVMRCRINTATCRCKSPSEGGSSPTSRPSRCRRLTSVRRRSASRPCRCCVKKRCRR